MSISSAAITKEYDEPFQTDDRKFLFYSNESIESKINDINYNTKKFKYDINEDESVAITNIDFIDTFSRSERKNYFDFIFDHDDIHKLSYNYILLQKYEGFVSEIKDESFIARLVNKTENKPDEEAEFSISEISHDDLDLLSPGAVFYWNIGYMIIGQQRIRNSLIKFRRLPVWSDQDLRDARAEAEEFAKILNE